MTDASTMRADPAAETAADALAGAVIARLRGVIGARSGPVPLHEPEFSGAEWDMVRDTLDGGWVSSVGKYVDRFEADIAAACGTRHAVAVVNGTAALEVALIVAGVAPGDEVLMPALSFVATANAALHMGAVPHFADVSPVTLGLDPEALGAHLERIAEMRDGVAVNRETGRRIAAVVPMHCFGLPAEMEALGRGRRALRAGGDRGRGGIAGQPAKRPALRQLRAAGRAQLQRQQDPDHRRRRRHRHRRRGPRPPRQTPDHHRQAGPPLGVRP